MLYQLSYVRKHAEDTGVAPPQWARPNGHEKGGRRRAAPLSSANVPRS